MYSEMFSACLLGILIQFTGPSHQCKSISTDDNKHHNYKWLPEDDVCGPVHVSPRIKGGVEAAIGQFPWMARLYTGDKFNLGADEFVCGGSLITKKHVLSAAHCIPAGDILEISHVRLGEHDTRTDPDCDSNNVCAPSPIDIKVDKSIVHEEYDTTTMFNDVALLLLQTEVDFNLHVAPICLPISKSYLSNQFPDESDVFEVAGWGIYSNDSDEESPVLRVLTVPYVSRSKCNEKFKELNSIGTGTIIGTQICAGGQMDKDSCQMDSGGPLMSHITADNTNQRYIIFGVVSYGTGHCGLGYPGVYTHIAHYVSWILDHLEV